MTSDLKDALLTTTMRTALAARMLASTAAPDTGTTPTDTSPRNLRYLAT